MIPVSAGPDVLSGAVDGGMPAETEAGGDAETEREGANSSQRSSEGRGGNTWQRDRGAPRAVQCWHGEAAQQHGAGVSGVYTDTVASSSSLTYLIWDKMGEPVSQQQTPWAKLTSTCFWEFFFFAVTMFVFWLLVDFLIESDLQASACRASVSH